MGISAAVAVVADIAGGAAVTAEAVGTIALAVSEVGVGLSVVGAVTHNQTLSQIGGVMGIAGAVTTLGASAAASGMFDAATDEVGSGLAGNTENIAADQNTSLTPDASTSPNNNVTASPTSSTNDPMSGSNTFGSGGNAAISSDNGLINNGAQANPAQVNSASASATQATSSNLPDSLATTSGSSTFGNAGSATVNADGAGNQLLKMGLEQSENNGSSLINWFDDLNSGTKAALVQGVGGALGGLSNAYTAQQKLALEQLINSQSFQKYQTAYSNVNAPSTISFTPATANPSNLVTGQQSSGLINSASKPAV
jgi:hypothetical protein